MGLKVLRNALFVCLSVYLSVLQIIYLLFYKWRIMNYQITNIGHKRQHKKSVINTRDDLPKTWH